MATYSNTKRSLLAQAGATQGNAIKGIPLKDGATRGWSPIRPCICVTEPCPCDDLEDLIVWLPSSKTGAKVGGEKSDDETLLSFPIDPDERVLVELQIPMTLPQLRQLKEWAGREPANGEGPQVVAKKKAKGVKAGAAATAAFEVGYALGTKIDEATGLSDKISDFAAEHIPWPW